MPDGNVYFSAVTEMSECLCTEYLLLCISAVTQAWWAPGEADLSSTLIEDLKRCVQKETQTGKQRFLLRPAVFTLGHFASLKQHCCTLTKELLWNSLHPAVQYIATVEVSVVVSFSITGIYLHDILNRFVYISLMDILHSCLHLALQLRRAGGAIVPHRGYFE